MRSFTSVFFLPLLLILSFCQSPTKQEKSLESTNAITGEEVTYSTDSTTMKGYIAYSETDSTKKPGILIVHEWWGHNEYVRNRARQLAEMGYVALAVDMYGEGKVAEHPTDAGNFAGAVLSNLDEAKARFEKAIETLKAHPQVDTEKIGAIGYCFGGSVVLSMANAGYEFDAVAAFHAGLRLPIMPDSGAVKARILVCNGAADSFISPEDIESYKNTMDAAGAQYEFLNLEGALHGFSNPEATSLGEKFGLPLAYQKEADETSWNKMQDLFLSAFE